MSPALSRVAALALGCFALLGACAAPASAAGEEFDKFGIASVSAGLSDEQAGAHADMAIGVKLTTKGDLPYARARDIEIALPPGFIGNPQAAPRCTVAQLGDSYEDSACPFETQVGTSVVRVIAPTPGTYNEPVYNMPAPKGTDIVARLGFMAVDWPTFINIRIDPEDFSLVATVEGIPSASGISEARTTIWGVPSASAHNLERITPEEAVTGNSPAGGQPVYPSGPFLSNPTDCTGSRPVRVTVRSYQLPEQPSTKEAFFPPILGCG